MKKYIKILTAATVVSLQLVNSNAAIAQTDSTSPLKITGYLETYYSYDFGNPANHTKQIGRASCRERVLMPV